MEEFIEIPTYDGHFIYGTLNRIHPKDRLIIFVHGLTGSQFEHQYFNAPRFFNSAFETFRFDFYSVKPRARLLSECSISIHAQDLNAVIAHFKGKYSEIFLVGHSLGCPTIIRSSHSTIAKIVLWDPTKGMRTLEEKKCSYIPEIGKYVLSWGKEMLINETMVNEWKACADLEVEARKIQVPCMFLFAEKNDSFAAWKATIERHNFPFALIKGASHVFVEEGAEHGLFQKTLEYLSAEEKKV